MIAYLADIVSSSAATASTSHETAGVCAGPSHLTLAQLQLIDLSILVDNLVNVTTPIPAPVTTRYAQLVLDCCECISV